MEPLKANLYGFFWNICCHNATHSSSGIAMATLTLPAGFDYRLTLTDITGKMVLNRQIAAGSQFFAFDNDLHAGVYFVNLWQDGFPVVTEKLVVVQQ